MGKSVYIPYDLWMLMDSSNSLIVPSWVLNEEYITSFNISNNEVLKRILIGDNCFGKVKVFELDGLNELESVVIGQQSFRTSGDGSYRIMNCPKLASIQTGGQSFSDYQSFELTNLHSLQSIDIGGNSFNRAPSFSLTGFDGCIGLKSQIFLNYNPSNLVVLHSVLFIRLCLRVIDWID